MEGAEAQFGGAPQVGTPRQQRRCVLQMLQLQSLKSGVSEVHPLPYPALCLVLSIKFYWHADTCISLRTARGVPPLRRRVEWLRQTLYEPQHRKHYLSGPFHHKLAHPVANGVLRTLHGDEGLLLYRLGKRAPFSGEAEGSSPQEGKQMLSRMNLSRWPPPPPPALSLAGQEGHIFQPTHVTLQDKGASKGGGPSGDPFVVTVGLAALGRG